MSCEAVEMFLDGGDRSTIPKYMFIHKSPPSPLSVAPRLAPSQRWLNVALVRLHNEQDVSAISISVH
jgi:hypothetical protein